eukprot:4444470-Karenia_brevis.AAC.1
MAPMMNMDVDSIMFQIFGTDDEEQNQENVSEIEAMYSFTTPQRAVSAGRWGSPLQPSPRQELLRE